MTPPFDKQFEWGFSFKVAKPSEFQDALDLRRTVYVQERGYAPEDSLDLVAHLLIACDVNGEVVACSRLVPPEQRPFDIEGFVDLRSIVPASANPAEVGRLCVRADHRKGPGGRFLQLGILKLSCLLAEKLKVTHFVMYTFEELRDYYRSVRFVDSGITFTHPGYREVMRVMYLDLIELRLDPRGVSSRLVQFLFSPNPKFSL